MYVPGLILSSRYHYNYQFNINLQRCTGRRLRKEQEQLLTGSNFFRAEVEEEEKTRFVELNIDLFPKFYTEE
jgi:hypothetical protein